MIAKLESMIAKLESMIDNFGINHSNNSWTTETSGLNEYKHSTDNLTQKFSILDFYNKHSKFYC
jgi:hypothetical protein